MMEARRVHILGILGQGTSALAAFLKASGHIVSGEDKQVLDPQDPLHMVVRELGLPLTPLVTDESLSKIDQLVPASYVPRDHPLVLRAQEARVEVVPRLRALRRALPNRPVVGVAGGVGKSTTTSLLHQIASGASDPGIYVGAACPHLGGRNHHIGTGLVFVEACEFRREFLGLAPEVAVVTNVLWGDHADYYTSYHEMCEAFLDFLHGSALSVLNWDDLDLRSLAMALPRRRQIRVGRSDEADWKISDVKLGAIGIEFSLMRRGHDRVIVRSPVVGDHNVSSMALAVACAVELGAVSAEAAARAAAATGVPRRRVEMLGTTERGWVVVDDYAHNPSQLVAGLSSVRMRWPQHDVVAVVQLSVHSRVVLQRRDLVRALSQVDLATLLPIQTGSLDDIALLDAVTAGDIAHDLMTIGTPAIAVAGLNEVLGSLRPEHGRPTVVYVAGSRRAAALARSLAAAIDAA
ncbi:MAG: Mur ligase family protein [Nocardioides sp.]